MTPNQRIFAVLVSVATLAFVVELVRRRKLKEEYSWLWILTSAGMIVLAGWYGLIERLTHLIGAVTVTTTLFLFGLLFLLVLSVHFSTVLSRLTQQVRRLTQEVAILAAERDQAGAEQARHDRAPDEAATR
ncbi:MAG TPA: DUF2304 domain-containing protein [Anaeromyxobacter sp.]|nr:DUF2304 domain-containing protein [Anaeromyxobacter sp.]